MYMPRNEFADFLLYVPDEPDTVYVVPRGKIEHDTAWAAAALEPYKEAWHLLKETTPALFERKIESLSSQLQRIIGEAKKRNLPYELIPLKQTKRKKDYRLYDHYQTYNRSLYAHYRTYAQRRILVKGKRCAIYTATLLPDCAFDGAVFKVPKDDWADVLLYIVNEDIYVVPREQMRHYTSLSLDSSLIYDYRNAWCVLDGVDPTSSFQMKEYRRVQPEK